MTSMTVNGEAIHYKLDPETPLLFALRDASNLTGTKHGCYSGDCGSCTVIADGRAVLSCQLTIAAAEGADITTIEGLVGRSRPSAAAGLGGRAGQPMRALRSRLHHGACGADARHAQSDAGPTRSACRTSADAAQRRAS